MSCNWSCDDVRFELQGFNPMSHLVCPMQIDLHYPLHLAPKSCQEKLLPVLLEAKVTEVIYSVRKKDLPKE